MEVSVITISFRQIALFGALLLAASAVIPLDSIDAKRRPPRNDWHDRYENRRDARRAGVVAGVVVGSAASAAARSKADRRYQECIYYDTYDYDCERMRYYEEQRARQGAWRAGVAAGIVTREIVRN